MKKKGLLAALLAMGIGFAAVSTTLYINGTSKINTNDDDFKVYYSDALVNGIQDLSVVVDETHLSFNTTLDTLGQSYVLDYDVTNGSKNYDADLEMTCTGGNEYLTVTNEFDDESILEALDTRSGKLTLTLSKSYTGDDLDVNIDCNIKANAVERNSLGSGTAASPVENPFAIGKEVTLAGEKFNVISQTENTVTLLASNVLGRNYRQTTTTDDYEYGVPFARENGWEYTPGPKEIDVFVWAPDITIYLNEYIAYLKKETKSTTITGDLITLAELKILGCTINDDYSYSDGLTCANSEHARWLVNNQAWWTRSAYVGLDISVWFLFEHGKLYALNYSLTDVGIRPVITISKDDLNNL